jgi:putative tricarboxylic transport membrane protein
MSSDLLSGLVLIALAALYYGGIGEIADSTLSDEVGAAGLPRVLASTLAGLGLLLVVRSFVVTRPVSQPARDPESEEGAHLLRAVSFLLFGAAYVLVLPFLGYLVSIALLIAAIAIFEGAERSWVVPVTAISGAVLYWAVFVQLLGVNQPVGSLSRAILP